MAHSGLWRRLFRRKLVLVAGIAGLAAAVTALRAGPASSVTADATDPVGSAQAAVQAALERDWPDLRSVALVRGGAAPAGVGWPAEVWFVAGGARGADLHRTTARIGPAGQPVAWGAVTAVPATPHGDEALLAAALGQALVSVSDAEGIHSLSARRRDGRRVDLHLTRPAKAVTGAFVDGGLVASVDGVAVQVRLATGEVTPPDAARLVPVDLAERAPLEGPIVAEPPRAPSAPASLADPPGPPWTPMPLAEGKRAWRRELDGAHLVLFDSRQVNLAWSAGTASPRPTTGRGGLGRHRAEAQALAWFDGVADGAGAVEAGRVLVPPRPLAASALLAVDGTTQLGAWDRDTATVAGDLRQAARALVLDGLVLPREDPAWGGPDARRRARRSALGATADGRLIFAWAPAVTATQLGDLLVEAGARYGLPLQQGAAARGLATRGPQGARPLAPEMGAAADWAPPRTAGAFLLIPSAGIGAGDPAWRPVGPAPARVAVQVRLEGPTPVRLARVLPGAVRVQLLPSVAEPHSGDEAPLRPPIAGEPFMTVTAGVRSARAPYGLRVGEGEWRAPREDAMTLAVDAEGRVALGRWRSQLDPSKTWEALVQGPGLLRGGAPALDPVQPEELPVVAVGRTADGALVMGSVSGGEVDALVAGLRAVGVVDAMRLADKGTVDGGQLRLGWGADAVDALTGAPRATPPGGTALALYPGTPPPSVQVVPAIRDALLP